MKYRKILTDNLTKAGWSWGLLTRYYEEFFRLIRDVTTDSPRHDKSEGLPLFEIASVLARVDHVARFIVNANHSVM